MAKVNERFISAEIKALSPIPLTPLKYKYRDPNNVPVKKNGDYKGRSNPAKGVLTTQGLGHRRRSYFTHISGGAL